MNSALSLFPAWILMAIAAVYYSCVLVRDHASGGRTWILTAVVCSLSAVLVVPVAGWVAGVTVFLALAGLVPFSLTWVLCLRRLLAARTLAVTSILFVSCALAPLCAVAVLLGLVLCGVSLYVGDSTWAIVGAAGSIVAALLVAGILLPTRKARKGARNALPADPPDRP